jgi:hypothetical protein
MGDILFEYFNKVPEFDLGIILYFKYKVYKYL